MAYIGNIPAENYASFLTETFTVSATANYTLSHAVTNENEIRLVINGVVQQPGSGKAYTASGTTLTLTSATSSGDVMYAVYLGRALQTVNPPAASVGNSQTAPTIITGQTAETSIATDDTILIHDTSASALRKMTRANFVSGIGGTNTPYFMVKKDSDQTINHASNTKITFDSTVLESSSNVFDLSNNKFTVATAGKYIVMPGITLYDSGNRLERGDMYIYKNGSLFQKFTHFDYGYSSSNSREYNLGHSFIASLAVNDYIEMYVYHNTNDSGSIVAESDHRQTYLSATKIIE